MDRDLLRMILITLIISAAICTPIIYLSVYLGL